MFQFALAGLGLASQAYGAYSQYQTSKKAAGVNQQIAAAEQNIENERHKQMVLNSRRQQVENIRNANLARSIALTTSVTQGANQGSGFFGGQAQISGMERYNSLGITQNQQIGDSIFGYNSQISQYKQQLAALGSENAFNQGISQLGGNLFNMAGSFSGNPFMKNSNSNNSNQWNFSLNSRGGLY